MSAERPGPKEAKTGRRTRTVLVCGGMAIALATVGYGVVRAEVRPAPVIAAPKGDLDANPGARYQDQAGDRAEAAQPKKASARIVETALAYAWPSGDHGAAQANTRNNYARELYTVAGLPPDDPNTASDDDPWSDCGVFVSFVMHKSGVDPNYPPRETNVQIDYLRKMSGATDPGRKYDQVSVTDPSQLQPGDILIFSQTYDDHGDNDPSNDDKDGHTYLFTGAPGPDGKMGTADDIKAVGASWKGHVPQRSSVYLTQDGRNNTPYHFSVFRFIQR